MKQPKTKYHGAGSEQFRADCAAAGIEPTDRQWRKYQRGEGAAYQVSAEHARVQAAALSLRELLEVSERRERALSSEHLRAMLR